MEKWKNEIIRKVKNGCEKEWKAAKNEIIRNNERIEGMKAWKNEKECKKRKNEKNKRTN